MTAIFVGIVIIVLFIMFKGPSKQGQWEMDQLYYGLHDFLRWQIDLCFIIFAVRDYANFDLSNNENKAFLRNCTDQVLYDITNKRLSSEFIIYYVIGAALKGAYIFERHSKIAVRILASTAVKKLLSINVSQAIYSVQHGHAGLKLHNICMEGAGSFAEFYKWKISGIQNDHNSSGQIIDHLIDEHLEYIIKVMRTYSKSNFVLNSSSINI